MDFDHIDTSNEMVKNIIKTSFEVFSKNEYKKASTNLIVQKAKISRGILYHYFKDKETLFDYLNFYSLQKGVSEVNDYIDWDNSDIIKRVCELTKYRLDVIAEYPYMIEFGEKYKDHIFKYANPTELRDWRERFFSHNVDYSLFKDELEIKKMLHIIKWTFRGLYKNLLEKPEVTVSETDILNLKEECNSYYEILKNNFYKGGSDDS
ncbi:MAG: TetR/AcrR family transcriptional regulator [Clostridiales bacterium]|nr:TetR/AcrR family transcriptional regulator [Clostridiales bacterium]